MEKRTIFLWSGLAALGIVVLIGLVWYLRAVNAPSGEAGSLGRIFMNTTAQPSAGTAGRPKMNDKIRPFTSLDQTPKEGPYVEGSGTPPSQGLPAYTVSPDGKSYTRNP